MRITKLSFSLARRGKSQLASTGINVSVDSLFDVQVKRIHEYKRQLLNILYVVTRYNRIRAQPDEHWVPRTVMFAGKAAPGYVMAKAIIRLINNVSMTINQDPRTLTRLKCVFLPDYDVSLAQTIMPAADLSEQISTAGMEASGTGNMKLALNGALTIGTLDGANIEILQEVGEQNFFAFGLDVARAQKLQAQGYAPEPIIEQSPRLAEAIRWIESGYFSPEDPGRFAAVTDSLRQQDPFMVCADFDAYYAAQEAAAVSYRDRLAWARKALHNIAGSARFSSDETIRAYARDIWQLQRTPVELDAALESGERTARPEPGNLELARSA